MRQFLLLGTLAASNIGVAFLYQWYVLVLLGAGMETDALFAGMTVPQLVLTVVSTSLTQVLVPLRQGESEDDLRRRAWGCCLLIGSVFTAIASLRYVTAASWLSVIVPAWPHDAQRLTVQLTRSQL